MISVNNLTFIHRDRIFLCKWQKKRKKIAIMVPLYMYLALWTKQSWCMLKKSYILVIVSQIFYSSIIFISIFIPVLWWSVKPSGDLIKQGFGGYRVCPNRLGCFALNVTTMTLVMNIEEWSMSHLSLKFFILAYDRIPYKHHTFTCTQCILKMKKSCSIVNNCIVPAIHFKACLH